MLHPTPSEGRLARLAGFAFRRRRAVMVAWLVGLIAAFGLASAFGGEFSADYSTPGSESKAAVQTLAERFPQRSQDTVDVVWEAGAGAQAALPGERVDALLSKAAALPGIGDKPPVRAIEVSRDGTIAVARLPLTESPDNVPAQTGTQLIELARDASSGGLRVELGGQVIESAQEGALSSEAVGLAVAALVLLFTFGTIVAAGLPIATALLGLGVASALGGMLTAVIDTPDWAPTVATMIGLGVGIDYALLILTRHRAAMAAGATPLEAAMEAHATAGRSVLIAGTTVVISMMGLFLMGLTYLQGVALSAIVAVLLVMAATMTMLPALLGFAGHGIDRLRIPGAARGRSRDPQSTPAARWGRAVQKRPWTAAVAAALVLLVMAVPVTGLRLGFPDAGNDRSETTTRQAYDLVSEGFGAGANGPLMLVAGTGDGPMLNRISTAVKAQAGVAAVTAPVVNPAGDTAVLTVNPSSSPQSVRTEELIGRLREDVLPRALRGTGVRVDVGGTTAATIDQGEATASRLPLFIGGVVGLSFLLLLVAFRSVTVAAKAGVMNLLSIGAAYGVISLLAEGGWAGQLIGIDTPTPVPPFIPVMMFAILFGLSMDYEVFLLSRVREEFLARGDTAQAVTEGLARTARVITAAALIMVAVFGAFALSPEIFLKLIGIGLATAILIDATLVRMVLVPAVMQLLGDRNWWMPRWLDRIIPRADLEGAAPAGAPA